MRVLLYSPVDLSRLGGTPFRVIKLAQHLGSAGYDVTLAANAINPNDVARFTFIQLRHPSFLSYLNPKQLEQVITAIKPDLVYAFAHLSLLTARVCAKRNVPLVAELHGIDSYSVLYQRRLPLLLGKLFDPFLRALVKPADHLVVVTPAIQEYYQHSGIPTTVMIMGTDLSPPEQPPPRTTDKIVVMYSGNFKRHQGIDLLFAAIKKIKQHNEHRFIFHFMGCDDHAFARYARKYDVRELCVNRGKPPFHNTTTTLASADVFVLPWVTSTMGKYCSASKLPDYLAMRKPIITTTFADPSHLVKDNGVSINEDPDELVKALHTITHQYASYHEKAKKYDLTPVTIQSNIDQLKKIFTAVLARNQ